jgi:RNA polymerase sigma-70 factor (ECF subfamily)
VPEHRAGEFEELYVRHERRVYAYLLTVLGNTADADDVLQQTGITLWKKFCEFPAGGDFLPWAIRTAYFTAKNYLRKHARSRVVFSQRMFEAVAEQAARQVSRPDNLHDALEECLRHLPEADRDLIRRRYEQELPVKHLAEGLDRSIHHVYRALARVHSSLFDCVSAKLATEDD